MWLTSSGWSEASNIYINWMSLWLILASLRTPQIIAAISLGWEKVNITLLAFEENFVLHSIC